MRAALKELFNNVITLQYKLPHNDTPKSIVSTCEDFAFKPPLQIKIMWLL